MSGAREVTVVRLQGEARRELGDHVAEEEPLEIQVQGVAVAVVMRTPGHDEELARGFLITERVVERNSDVRRIRHCDTVPDPEAEDNVIQVSLEDNVDLDLERLRRNLYASSSCGVCGKATIENVMSVAPPLQDSVRVDSATIYRLPERLRAEQATFDSNGRSARGRLVHSARRASVPPGGRGPAQRGGQDRGLGGRQGPAARGARAHGVGPGRLRDRAEGPRGAHPNRRRHLGAIVAGRSARRSEPDHAHRFPARDLHEHLLGFRADRLLDR